MGLEAVIICIDNSEWMRNSDFSPSRSEAQEDACNLICGTKTRQNLENVVGLITTAGKAVEVRVSLTQDLAKFLTALHKVKIGGKADVVSAIQVAQLALRHRQNKLQAQRIVLFVGSPVEEPVEELVKLAQQLKKNKIAVDLISFGEVNAELNQPKLEAFQKAVNNGDNSSLVTIPPGARMLSELLAKTAIVRGDAPEGSGAGAGNGAGFDFVDENMDPELAMTLKLSIETEEAERKARAAAAGGEGAEPSVSVPMEEEDPELAEALRQSLLDNNPTETISAPMATEDDDDEELAQALLLSQQTAAHDQEADEKTALLSDQEKPKDEEDNEKDKDAEEQILLSLPDIDPNDPDVQTLLAQIRGQTEKK